MSGHFHQLHYTHTGWVGAGVTCESCSDGCPVVTRVLPAPTPDPALADNPYSVQRANERGLVRAFGWDPDSVGFRLGGLATDGCRFLQNHHRDRDFTQAIELTAQAEALAPGHSLWWLASCAELLVEVPDNAEPPPIYGADAPHYTPEYLEDWRQAQRAGLVKRALLVEAGLDFYTKHGQTHWDHLSAFLQDHSVEAFLQDRGVEAIRQNTFQLVREWRLAGNP